ncbi:MAG: SusC/RagA family TonB-linked outer membrane protein [Edaphocola sp.]
MKINILKTLLGIGIALSCCMAAKAQDVTTDSVATDEETSVTVEKVTTDTVAIKEDTTSGKKKLLVKGQVIDAATGKGIDGARLRVPGFSATIADTVGVFTLRIPNSSSVITVESEGFDKSLVPVKKRDYMVIRLQSNTVYSYNDEVIMPLATEYRQYQTTPVDQVVIDGWQQPTETVDALLQGKVAGLNSIRRSGMQGVGANMFLNGINSLYATNKPLIIIDGMPYDANDYGLSLIANNYTNPLNLIDAKDIDNVTVLKDAASIYGSKGANGAILINTVSANGRLETKIDAGVFVGANYAPKRLPVLNAADYRIYLARALSSSGMSESEISALPYMSDDATREDYYKNHNNTDWQREVFANSMAQNAYLRVTGGDNIATYGLTVGYMKNMGVVKNTDLERYNTRFNALFNFTEKLTGSANLSFSYNNSDLKDQGISDKTAPIFNALVKAPFFTANELASDGTASPNYEAVDTLGISNPAVIINGIQASNKYYRFFGNFRFNYEINRYLSASTLLGVQYDKVRESYFVPSKGVVKDTLWNDVADNRMGSQVKTLFSVFNDTKLEFARKYNYIHSVSARLGVRYQTNKARQISVTTANSATDDLVTIQNGLATLRQVTGDMGEWNWLNTYLGADYSYADKLFVNVRMAMDGSSRFGVEAKNGLSISGHKFPVFPAISAAWLVSSEKFMSGSFVHLLKLRASYSVAGNDDIGNYSGQQLYVAQNLLGAQGFVRKGIANPALQWETRKMQNAGIDFSFWKERVSLSADIYNSTTDNMLVHTPLQSVTGFSSVLTNDGKLRNTGIEASLNVRLLNNKNLKWDFGFNIAKYQNKILQVPDGEVLTDFAGATIRTANGQPANQFYGYKTDGIFSSDAEAAEAGLYTVNTDGSQSAFTGGDVKFVDMNGDKIIDSKDRTVIGDANPQFFGGISNRIVWKWFELNALVTFTKGNDAFNYLRYRLESQSGVENQLQSVMNSWRYDGQQTTMPKTTWGDPMGNNRFSDRWIEDGSYLRLRSVSLTFNVPIKSTGAFKSMAVYVTGNNLVTLTKYLGYDPEFSSFASPLAQGIDTGSDPLFKSVVFGVRIGL